MNDELTGGDNDGTSLELWPTALSSLIAVSGLTMSLLSIIFLGVVFTTLKFTFNAYIVLIMLPDLFANLSEGVRSVYELTHDGVLPMNLCIVRSFYIMFYYFSNIYMNAVVAKEIYTLVWNSWRRKRTQPPTMRKVLLQGAAVYLFAALVSAWLVTPVKWSPLTVVEEPVCALTYGSSVLSPTAGRIIGFGPIVPPFLYFFWVAYKIKRDNLLPRTGRTKALAMYYLRIAVVFIAFYIPMTACAIAKNSIPKENQDSTVFYVLLLIIALLFPMQNLVTIYFSMQKDDVREAIDNLVPSVSSILSSISPIRSRVRVSEWNLDDTYMKSNASEVESSENGRNTE